MAWLQVYFDINGTFQGKKEEEKEDQLASSGSSLFLNIRLMIPNCDWRCLIRFTHFLINLLVLKSQTISRKIYI